MVLNTRKDILVKAVTIPLTQQEKKFLCLLSDNELHPYDEIKKYLDIENQKIISNLVLRLREKELNFNVRPGIGIKLEDYIRIK